MAFGVASVTLILFLGLLVRFGRNRHPNKTNGHWYYCSGVSLQALLYQRGKLKNCWRELELSKMVHEALGWDGEVVGVRTGLARVRCRWAVAE
jgi:hypothetical protein